VLPADASTPTRSSACARSGWPGIKQEKARPGSLARRAMLPPLLYGAGHPYATAPSGTGTEASIAGLTQRRAEGLGRGAAAARSRDGDRRRRHHARRS
jgi:hypothetical protein